MGREGIGVRQGQAGKVQEQVLRCSVLFAMELCVMPVMVSHDTCSSSVIYSMMKAWLRESTGLEPVQCDG